MSAFQAALPGFQGIRVVESPHLRRDQAYLVGGMLAAAVPEVVVGTRPLTDVELAGRWAAWFVRKSYADAGYPLPGPVGPEPTRDNVGLVVRIQGLGS